MNIGDIIKKRRTDLGLTLGEVGDRVGVAKSTVKKWENGYIENMKRDKIALLAKTLRLSPVTFITGELTELSNVTQLSQTNVFNIPVFNSVSAGFGALAVDEIVSYTPLYFESKEEAKETICIKVKGDSMFPKIEDGDLIQVHKQDSVDSGSVAVCLLDGDNGVVKKIEYRTGEDWLELHSFNPMYQTMRFEGPDVQRIRVVGLVKKVIKSL